MTRALLVLATLAALALPGAGSRPASADPLYCFTVYNSNGQPVDTVCVPRLSL
jgi:hypothetical protein